MGSLKASQTGTVIGKGIEYTTVTTVESSPGTVYIVYFLLGAGFILPWNAFLTGVDYFEYLYPDVHIDRVFTVAYLVPCLAVLACLGAFRTKFGARTRITCGLSLFIVSIAIVPIIEALFIRGERGTARTHAATIFAVSLAGVGDAFVQGTLIGTANNLPGRFIQALVSGTGFSGVLISFLRIVTKASFSQTSDGLRNSANVYFTVSAIFLGLCIVSYNLVYEHTVAMACMEFTSRTLMCDEFATSDLDAAEKQTPGIRSGGFEEANDESDLPVSGEALGPPSARPEAFHEDTTHFRSGFWQVCLQLRLLAGVMVLTYMITLSIFPGFLTEDVKSPLLGDWYPVLLIAIFNVFDLVGKSLTAVRPLGQDWSILMFSVGRMMFFPLYSACIHGPRLFRTEGPVFLLTALLGGTDGYLTTSLFLSASRTVVKGARAETVGVVMVMGIEVGLTLGSLISWVWVV